MENQIIISKTKHYLQKFFKKKEASTECPQRAKSSLRIRGKKF